jgi:hypothetical protein
MHPCRTAGRNEIIRAEKETVSMAANPAGYGSSTAR